jgi:hypothetical protein
LPKQPICAEQSNSHVHLTRLSLASNELLPCLGALAHNLHSVLLVLALPGERKLVLRLAIGDLVDAEPLVGSAEETRKVPLDILHIVQARGERVVHVNDNDFPVGLALVEESHDAEDLDLLDLARLGNELTDLADVEWVVVSLLLGLGVGGVWVLPCLGESAVVPEVALVWEAVADEAELALLGVLLDWVKDLVLGDLPDSFVSTAS